MIRRRLFTATVFARVAIPSSAFAHEPATGDPSIAVVASEAEPRAREVEDVVVHGEARGVDAASRVHVGRRELELRPRQRPGDVLEAAPGLFAVQHAGGGKANQYFLRGFDADHGTDVAFFVDGVPVNMPSHGHGQGFTDVHFVIPELVVGVDAAKGPYYADLGNFATAGAVKLQLADTYGEHVAHVTAGSFGVRRGLVIASPSLGEDWKLLLAGEAAAQDGPFQLGENLSRANLFAKLTHEPSARARLALTAMSYGSTWRASGQIPVRAVCGEGEPGLAAPASYGKPCLDRFGFVDPSEGGSTARSSLSALYTHATDDTRLRALAYAIRYDFRLHSNFTFFADDPQRGDGIEQTDARTVLGTNVEAARHWHVFGAPLVVRAGVDVRRDGAEVELWRQDQARTRLEAKNRSAVHELASAGYLEGDARLSDEVRVVAGLRAQRLDVTVTDRLTETGPGSGSGARGASLALPKLSVIVTPREDWQLFANAGRGFHSNDARGAVLRAGAARLLTPAWGAEIGARHRPVRGIELTAVAFGLDLDSELVWSGDAGTTEASASSRRVGLELGARYAIASVFFADLDATFTSARFRDVPSEESAVPLAPRRTLSAGFGARPTFGAFTPFAALRVKHLGDRPANEDRSLTAAGFTVVDANVGVRYRGVEAALDVQNLLDVDWREVQFATTSRLAYEPAAVSGIAMTPGWPRTILARVALYAE
jgi:outer membrane receptor protein involved in Fe transport